MKSKIKRGKGFKGCLQYIFSLKKDKEDKPAPDFICSNMFGDNIKELTQEFTQTRNIRPEVEKPVWHTSLSLTPEEEKLGPEKWQEIAENYLEKMGFDLANNQYVVVRHNDTEKDHIHILANRVGLDGTVWAGKFEALKSIDVCQELEKSHGLTITKGLDRSDKPDVKTPTKEEIEMGLREGKGPLVWCYKTPYRRLWLTSQTRLLSSKEWKQQAYLWLSIKPALAGFLALVSGMAAFILKVPSLAKSLAGIR